MRLQGRDAGREVGICEALLNVVLSKVNNPETVTRIHVTIGSLLMVDAAAVGNTFDVCAASTGLTRAELSVQMESAVATCRGCACATEAPAPLPACPRCHCEDLSYAGGTGVKIRRIETR